METILYFTNRFAMKNEFSTYSGLHELFFIIQEFYAAYRWIRLCRVGLRWEGAASLRFLDSGAVCDETVMNYFEVKNLRNFPATSLPYFANDLMCKHYCVITRQPNRRRWIDLAAKIHIIIYILRESEATNPQGPLYRCNDRPSDQMCSGCGRSFRVKVGNALSSSRFVLSGVPEGSILGPLLFLLYVNDLPKSLLSCCKLYADDVKIYRPITDPQFDYNVLRQDMISLEQWSQLWQLDISPEKCFVLHLNFSTECPLHLCGFDLPAKEVMKDLGVYVSSDLNWHNHCVEVSRRAAQVANHILRAVQYSSVESYRKAFVAYCRPILEYCTQVWSPSVKRDIEMIERVQRRFTKMAFRKAFRGPFQPNYEQRLRIFDLKPLWYRRTQFDLHLCFKIVKGFSGIPFKSIFSVSAAFCLWPLDRVASSRRSKGDLGDPVNTPPTDNPPSTVLTVENIRQLAALQSIYWG
ncbi:putative RNA-directed DNA polymerase from transposon BS [Toxocara canis]|uniref:Putative RNA-directed DNA polymerase from transposon BS n=1 Tax=Toxocara canis TaxID=6265 RepID=A0A0B2W628_TOXCA|nr:putative RNA-directed DNA polymerase from transposon BS [Toxocara canis]